MKNDLHETQAAIAGLTQHGIDREKEARAVERSELDRIKATLAPVVKEAQEAVDRIAELNEVHGPTIREIAEVNWDRLQRVYSQDIIGRRIGWLKRSLDDVQGWLQLADQYRRAIGRYETLNAKDIRFGEHIPLEAQIRGAMTTVDTLKKEIPQLFRAVREVHEAVGQAEVPLPQGAQVFITPIGVERVQVIRET